MLFWVDKDEEASTHKNYVFILQGGGERWAVSALDARWMMWGREMNESMGGKMGNGNRVLFAAILMRFENVVGPTMYTSIGTFADWVWWWVCCVKHIDVLCSRNNHFSGKYVFHFQFRHAPWLSHIHAIRARIENGESYSNWMQNTMKYGMRSNTMRVYVVMALDARYQYFSHTHDTHAHTSHYGTRRRSLILDK